MLVKQGQTNVKTACRLFGHCRQAYYQLSIDHERQSKRNREIVSAVKQIREEDPGLGCLKLFIMICSIFGREQVPGRDSFFKLLRRHKLMLKRPKPRRTTVAQTIGITSTGIISKALSLQPRTNCGLAI